MSTEREAIIAALMAKKSELEDAAVEVPRNADLYLDRASMFEVAAVIAKTAPTPTTEGAPS